MKLFFKPITWLLILLAISLSLAACGGEATPEIATTTTEAETIEEPAADTAEVEAEVEVVASDEPVQEDVEEVVDAANAEEPNVPEAADEASSEDENLPAPDQPLANQAVCQSVDVPVNPFVAQVSDSDWSKGPADAPVTIIEYGDFQ